MKKTIARVLLGLVCGWGAAAWGGVRVNEVCADNGESLLTQAGKAEDWVELYNDSASAADLTGWYLTDNLRNLTKWQFPSGTSIPANGYLIVFADGSDVPLVNGELHTSFSFSKDGEDVALVRPDGTTVESGFTFGRQLKDVTVGYQHKDIVLLAENAAVQYTVPNAAGNAPTKQGTSGLGFVATQGSFNVTFYKMKSAMGNVDTAIAWTKNPSQQNGTTVTSANTLSYRLSNEGTIFPAGAFPTGGLGNDNFVVVAEGGIYVPSPGVWTFAVASDDGFRLTISGHGQTFISEHPSTRGTGTTFGHFNFPSAGVYDVNLTMFQDGGGASLEFAVAQGTTTAWNTSTFKLVGDSSSPVQMAGAFGAFIGTDVGAEMKNVNSRLDAQYTFTLDAVEPVDAYMLHVRYSDGFSASVNGTPIASANMPSSLAWNSVATGSLTVDNIIAWKTYSIPVGVLQAGVNTLSVIALNNSASDGDFFIQPKIVQTTDALHLMYFKDPTPGAANAKGYNPPTPMVAASEPRGYKYQPFTLALSCEEPGTPIYYTLDGSMPSAANGTLYTAPFSVSATTVLRAAAVDPLAVWQNIDTVTYLFLTDVLAQPAIGNVPPSGWPANGAVNGHRMIYGMDQTVVNNWRPQIYAGFTNEIPTLSLVTDLPNLFSPSTGIYVNSGNHGIGWERPMSLEMIDPKRGVTKEFQIDAGMRIRGGYSRRGDNPKYSFRFFFRSGYGTSKLAFPMFEDEGADLFGKFDLRCSQNHSWVEGSDDDIFINDISAHDTMRALGEHYTRGRFYHLYINGQYWGLYQTQERVENEFAATYLGDPDKSHYDAIRTSGGTTATDGTIDGWQSLWNYSMNYSMASAANYYRLQGLNPDGSRNPSYPILLDVTNLIHRYFVTQTLRDGDSPIWGNSGPNNQAALYNRVAPEGFKFFPHDSEWSFGSQGGTADDVTQWGANNGVPWPNFNQFNPTTLHVKLTENAEYRKTFADLVQKHFYNDGALTPENNVARFQNRMAQIYNSVCCESARWGRSQNNNGSSRTQANWLNRCGIVTNNFILPRNGHLINQFKGNGWIPLLDAPVKRQPGRVHPYGKRIDVTCANTFYYTLNGADPLLPDGSLSLAAKGVLALGGRPTQTYVSRGATWKYYDNGNEPPTSGGLSWKAPGFDATAWPQGPAILGFAGGAPTNPVATQTKRYVNGVNGTQVTTTYFRHTFTINDVSSIDDLVAEMLCDDGAVIYLNGVELMRYNMNPGTPTYNDYSINNISGDAQVTYYTYLNLPRQHLQNGVNVLAAEVHQCNATSTDLYFDFALKTPGDDEGDIYVASFSAGERTTVMARAFDGTTWSALAEITFEGEEPPPAPLGSDYSALRMSKLMYAPPNATAPEVARGGRGPAGDNDSRDYYAWFELCNTDPVYALDMTGFTITNNITLNASAMNGVILPPGGRIFVVKNLDSFNARYPNNTRAAVAWSNGNISRSGGNSKEFFLVAPDGSPLYTIWYDGDNWFDGGAAKNTGLWLDADLSAPSTAAYSTEAGWRLSGLQEAPLVPADAENLEPPPDVPPDYSAIRVTRLMFAPLSPTDDELVAFPTRVNDHYAWLELANTGPVPINLNNYVMSNNISCVFGNVTLPPGGRYTVTKNKDCFDFRHPEGRAPNDTARDRKNWDSGNISRSGGEDKPFDFYAPDGTLLYSLTYSEDWLDRAARNTGLWLKLKDWGCPLSAMSTEDAWELEAPLSAPSRLSEFTVSEINFAPADGRVYEQFIEFLNPGYGLLDISGVKVSGSVTFTFPPDTYLEAGCAIVIVKHASEFAARYQDPASPHYYPGINVAGEWAGDLPESGEGTVTLAAADNTAIGSVTFSSSWIRRTAGRGSSLEVRDPFNIPRNRTAAATLLNDPDAWQASSLYHGSPGRIDNMKCVVINEVLSHSPDDERFDWVELLNTGDTAIDLSTLYLSDHWSNLLRKNLSGTIAPGGFAVIDLEEESEFGISELGEPVILVEAVDGHILRYHDSVEVPAMDHETIGRFQITDGSYVFTEMAEATQGAHNTLPRIGPVVISEIMVRPENGKAQYVELTNITDDPVPLFDPLATTNTWKFSGFTFTFPQGVTMLPRETILVVATNAATFLEQYSGRAFNPSVRIFDQWTSGRLSSSGETIALMYPGKPHPDTVPYYRMDWFTYKVTAPWPEMTRGASYEKYPVQAYGGDPVYWRNVPGGTPGYASQDAENPSRHILIQSAPDKPLDYSFTAPYAPWIDAATIAYLSGEMPPGATYDPLTQTFTWPNTATGNYSFSVLVTDALGGVSTQWVRIAVSDAVEDGKVTLTTATDGTAPSGGGADTPPLIDGTPKLGGILGPDGPAAAATDTPLILDGPVLDFLNHTPGPLRTQPAGLIRGWFHRGEDDPLFTQLAPPSNDRSAIILTNAANALSLNANGGETLLAFATNSVCPPQGTRVPLSSSHLVEVNIDLFFSAWADDDAADLTDLQTNGTKTAFICLSEQPNGPMTLRVAHGGRLGVWEMDYNGAGFATAMTRDPSTSATAPLAVTPDLAQVVTTQLRTLRKGDHPLPYPVTVFRVLVNGVPCHFERGFAFTALSTEDDLGDDSGGEWLLAICYHGAWNNPALIANAADNASMNAMSVRNAQDSDSGVLINWMSLVSAAVAADPVQGKWNIALPDPDKAVLQYSDNLGWWTYNHEFPLVVTEKTIQVLVTNTAYAVTVLTNATEATNPVTLAPFMADTLLDATRYVTYAFGPNGIIDRIPDPAVRDALLLAIGEQNRSKFEDWFRNKSGLLLPTDINAGTLARVLNAYLCNIPYADWSDDLLKFVTPPAFNGDGTVSAIVNIGVMTFAADRLDVNGVDIYHTGTTLGDLQPAAYTGVRLAPVPGDPTKMKLTVPVPGTFSGFLRIRIQP
ncbi:MAG: lamin tail domain-containing protein [Kiritimatiellaeota bacterium]|nr:lamin tail domain-containing protein [Kiritimatiellota bacterium]